MHYAASWATQGKKKKLIENRKHSLYYIIHRYPWVIYNVTRWTVVYAGVMFDM